VVQEWLTTLHNPLFGGCGPGPLSLPVLLCLPNFLPREISVEGAGADSFTGVDPFRAIPSRDRLLGRSCL